MVLKVSQRPSVEGIEVGCDGSFENLLQDALKTGINVQFFITLGIHTLFLLAISSKLP